MRFENKDIIKPILSLGLISIYLLIFLPGELLAECSFWAAIADKVPGEVIIDQLLNSPNSLKSIAKYNKDGWGIGYYDKGEAELLKGMVSADLDQSYDRDVREVSGIEPKIVVAHVRTATSGCRENVVNPHPFKKIKNGRQWLFGHNGTLDKNILMGLIGDDYLKKNQPDTCTYDPPESWVDSELYFILLLKYIEENGWNANAGIEKAIFELNKNISGSANGLNFFLTDGNTLWSFRKGRPLYYYYQVSSGYAAVASMFPNGEKESWIEVPENSLVVMKAGIAPGLISFSAPVASAIHHNE